MAEALAIIGLASAVLQFVDFGSKVVRQLHRFEKDIADMPMVFQSVRTRLPLMVELMNKLLRRMDAGLISERSQAVMLPVVESCAMQARHLDALVQKALPEKNESHWSRGKKVVFGVLAESEIERCDTALKKSFDLLVQASNLHSASQPPENDLGPSKIFDKSGLTVNIALLPNHQVNYDASLLVSNQQTTLDPHPRKSIFMVPFQRDTNFLGRTETLDWIDQRLQKQPCVALSGLGGIGSVVPYV